MINEYEQRELNDIIRKQSAIITRCEEVGWDHREALTVEYSELEYRRIELEDNDSK
jgi:hypothetical protein